MINQNLESRLYHEILIHESRLFITIPMLYESIHPALYGLQLEAYVYDPSQSDKLFSAL